MRRLSPSAGLLLVLLLAAVVRVPFWVAAWRMPIDGDLAIVGLMARHPFRAFTLWGQPYGSPLEGWLAIPFVYAFGMAPAALRVMYFLLGLSLVPAAYALARALDPRAALPAAFVMACPSPYFLLLAAYPPPLYPATLLLCAALLLLALRTGPGLASGRDCRPGLVLWGTLAGIALWTHLMSASVVAATAAYLTLRGRHRPGRLAWALLPALLASAPLLADLGGSGAAQILSVSSHDESMPSHLLSVLPELHRPILGLMGAHVPLLADDPDHSVEAPRWAAAVLVLLHLGVLVGAARRGRGRGGPALLLSVIGLAILAFPWPHRAAPHTVRFLTLAYLPQVALAGWVPLTASSTRRSWALALAFAALNLATGSRLLAAWRGGEAPSLWFALRDLSAVRKALDAAHVSRAYAPYDLAYRLTYESGERIIASEPWNERFRHYPLPYLDEVRFAKNVAWLLVRDAPGDLPTPKEFEQALGAIGGVYASTSCGKATIYSGFVPPFGARVEPLRSAGPAGDADWRTAIEPDRSGPTTFILEPPRSLDAVTLLSGPGGGTLPRSFDVEVSADGVRFEVAARRRRREERNDLRWANGHPQYILDHRMVAVPLGGRTLAAIRLSPYMSDEKWALAEILLHPAQAPAARQPWDEWLPPDLTWQERRQALKERPQPDREDWYFRSLVADEAR